jgi:hypothetical protein
LSGALVFTLVLPLCASNWGIGGVLLATGTGMVVWALGLALQLKRICGLDVNFAVMRPGIAVMLSVILYKLIEPVGVFFALISAWVILFVAASKLGLFSVLYKNKGVR